MALKSSESPNVTVREVDLTGVVPATASTTGAFAGEFNWGPALKPTLVSNEAELALKFGSPVQGGASASDFLSVAQFLKYSSTAYVTRIVNDGDTNAAAEGSAGGTEVVAGGSDITLQYDGVEETYFYELPFRVGDDAVNPVIDSTWKTNVLDSDGAIVHAVGTDADASLTLTTPASSGNSRLEYTPEVDGDGVVVTPHPEIVATWMYDKPLPTGIQVLNGEDFEQQDLTSYKIVARYPGARGNLITMEVCPPVAFTGWSHASKFASAPEGSEVHVVVLVDGEVVETHDYLSTVEGAKLPDGSANNVLDVINNKSDWVWAASIGTLTTSVVVFTLSGGANGDHVKADYVTAFGQYADVDSITVDFLVSPSRGQNDGIDVEVAALAAARKDCVAVVSPYGDAIKASSVDDIVTWSNGLPNSDYLICDGNWLKVYNKYQDKYETIAAASSTAGIMAASDRDSAPWFSPAGSRRGQYFGVTSLVFNPTKGQRDTLYSAKVNPIVSLPGQGTVLFGDKTHLSRPSAFDRINVRRLFLVIERSIAEAGKNAMFEFNDEFTRAEFVNIVEPFLREIQGRRGITDFRVVCDETNNTSAVVDRNEFVATVFIKPARSINYVTLNFVAVRSGVEFEEVVGTV